MKVLHYLLFAILASQYLSQRFCTKVAPTKAEDCHNALKESDGLNFAHCCYVNYKFTLNGKTNAETLCAPATKAMYDEFSTLYDIAKKSAEELNINDLSLDVNCNSKYLVISILSMLLFLL